MFRFLSAFRERTGGAQPLAAAQVKETNTWDDYYRYPDQHGR